MKKNIFKLFCGTVIIVASNNSIFAAWFDHSHQLFGRVLKKILKDNLVDYAGLKNEPKDLVAYLDQLASVPESEFKKWNQAQRIAYLVNLYNAQTLKLIIDHYPVKSIKDIGGVLKGPWKQPVVRLFGKTITLDDLEHGILRKDYAEPRLHFALVCAAMGCPPLKNEPFTAANLNAQLEEQGKVFFAQKHKNSVDIGKKVVNLSPIFKWFEEDFTKNSGTVIAFVQSYFSPEVSRELVKGGYKINYTHYDWSLNDQATKR